MTARAVASGTPRPPQMQRAGVSVTNGFLARGFRVDRLQRERDLDEFLLCGHSHTSLFYFANPQQIGNFIIHAHAP